MPSLLHALAAALLVLVTGAVASCGQKGPLYLPEDDGGEERGRTRQHAPGREAGSS